MPIIMCESAETASQTGTSATTSAATTTATGGAKTEDDAPHSSRPPSLLTMQASSIVIEVSGGALSLEWGHHEEHLAQKAFAVCCR
jgi:hypothetical protein